MKNLSCPPSASSDASSGKINGSSANRYVAPPDLHEKVARALHDAHKPWCDWTYPFEHPQSSREVYEALATAALEAVDLRVAFVEACNTHLREEVGRLTRERNDLNLLVDSKCLAVETEITMSLKAEIERLRERVSDGSPEGVKTQSGLIEDDSAVTEGQTPSPIPHPQGEVEKVIEDLREWALVRRSFDFGPSNHHTKILDRAAYLLTTYAEDNERLRNSHEAMTLALARSEERWQYEFKQRLAAQAEIEKLRGERDGAREYTIQLQRIIESVCHGNPLREDSKHLHHHKMAEAALSQAEEMRKALAGAREYITVHHHGIGAVMCLQAIDTALSLMKGGENA